VELGGEYAGIRLDIVLASLFPGHSRSSLVKRIKEGAALLDGKPAWASLLVKSGQTLTFTPPLIRGQGFLPAPGITLRMLYEDDDILVIDKPAGLTIHPGSATSEPTLIEALLAGHPELLSMDGGDRCGIVHRLDKDTTGVLLVARNKGAREFLTAAFADRKVGKRYLAFVRGNPLKTGTIVSTIGRHPARRYKMAAGVPGGREARTSYRVLRRFPKTGISLISIALFTGRTHQARVHLASKDLPVLGDAVYGGSHKALYKSFPSLVPLVKRQFLHARRLKIPSPGKEGHFSFASPWPEDFVALYQELLALEGT
jgi:23S rRNA pseudouridine1911/1915/1917 synthase